MPVQLESSVLLHHNQCFMQEILPVCGEELCVVVGWEFIRMRKTWDSRIIDKWDMINTCLVVSQATVLMLKRQNFPLARGESIAEKTGGKSHEPYVFVYSSVHRLCFERTFLTKIHISNESPLM